MLSGDLADPSLEMANVLRQEPGLGQDPVLRVIGGIHLHEGPNQVRTAPCHLADGLVALDAGEGGGHVAGVEQVVLAADLENVGMLADDSEGKDPFQMGHAQGLVGAQPSESLVHRRILGVGLGCDHRASDILGNVDGLAHGAVLVVSMAI
jgi:hypothetical protein